jgi:peptidoglycan/LPS O-acetylase OafA/YrhL
MHDWLDRVRTAFAAVRARWSVPLTPSVSVNLDAARWIAATLVLIYHLRINVLVDPLHAGSAYAGLAGQTLYLLTMEGNQAVMWFFVISGYLVGGSVVSQMCRDKFSFSDFALHRATRLYVVLIPALLVGFALDFMRIKTFGMSFSPPAGGETAASYTLATFGANLVFLQTLAAPTLGSNNPLWSLANEAWYYAVFPLLLAPFMTGRPKILRGGLFFLALAIIVVGFHANKGMVTLFSAWILGVAVRLAPIRLMSSISAAWLVAAVAIFTYPLVKGHMPHIVPALAFTNVLLTASHDKGHSSSRYASFHAKLAGFSFSLYLVHAPMLHFLLTKVFGQSNPYIGLPIGWPALGIGSALFLALYAYAWVFSLLTERNTDTIRRWVVGRTPDFKTLSRDAGANPVA